MTATADGAGKADRRVKALLLAGGLGTRLRPITETTPKCLVPIAGRPLLDYWFDALAAADVYDVRINTHHLPDAVRAYIDRRNRGGRFRVSETHEPELLGSAATVHANRGWMDDADECIVIYADNLSSVDLGEMLRYHRSHSDGFTMLLFHAPEPTKAGIAETDRDGRIVSFVEKPERPASDLANGGVYIVSGDAYREIADMDAFDLGFDVLPRFVGRMRGWAFDGYHRDIGNLDALERARAEARDVFCEGTERGA